MVDPQAALLQSPLQAGQTTDQSDGRTAPQSDSDASASIDEEEDSDSGSDEYCEQGRKGGRARGARKSSIRKRRKRPEWTRSEEETLAQLHCGIGNQWSIIAARLPGRTPNEVKNIWHSTLRSKHLKARSLLRAYATALNGRWDDEGARQEAYDSALRQHGGDETEGAEGPDAKAHQAASGLPFENEAATDRQPLKADEQCATPTNAEQPLVALPTASTPQPLTVEPVAPGASSAPGGPLKTGRVPSASPGGRNSASSRSNPRAGQSRLQQRTHIGSSRIPKLLSGLAPVKTTATSYLCAGAHVFTVSSPAGALQHVAHGPVSAAATTLQQRPLESHLRFHTVEMGARPSSELLGPATAGASFPLSPMGLPSCPPSLPAVASPGLLEQHPRLVASLPRPFDATPVSNLWQAGATPLAQQQSPWHGQVPEDPQGRQRLQQALQHEPGAAGHQPTFQHPWPDRQANQSPLQLQQQPPLAPEPQQTQEQPPPTQQCQPQNQAQWPVQEQQQPSGSEERQALHSQIAPKSDPMQEDQEEEEACVGPLARPSSGEVAPRAVAAAAGAGAAVGLDAVDSPEAMEGMLGIDMWLDRMDPAIMLRDEEDAEGIDGGGGGGVDAASSSEVRAVSVAAAMAAAAAGEGSGRIMLVGQDPARLVESGPASGAWSCNGDANDPSTSRQPQPRQHQQQRLGCSSVLCTAPNSVPGRDAGPEPQAPPSGQQQPSRNAAPGILPVGCTSTRAVPTPEVPLNAGRVGAWCSQAHPGDWQPGTQGLLGSTPSPYKFTTHDVSAQSQYAAPSAGRPGVGPSRGLGAALALTGSWTPQRAGGNHIQMQLYADRGGGGGDTKSSSFPSTPSHQAWQLQQPQQQPQGVRAGPLRSGVHQVGVALAMVPVGPPPHLAGSPPPGAPSPYPYQQQYGHCAKQQPTHYYLQPLHSQQYPLLQQQQTQQEQQYLQLQYNQRPQHSYGQSFKMPQHCQQNYQQDKYRQAVHATHRHVQEPQDQKQRQARHQQQQQEEQQQPPLRWKSDLTCMTDVVTMGFESLHDPELQWCIRDVV